MCYLRWKCLQMRHVQKNVPCVAQNEKNKFLQWARQEKNNLRNANCFWSPFFFFFFFPIFQLKLNLIKCSWHFSPRKKVCILLLHSLTSSTTKLKKVNRERKKTSFCSFFFPFKWKFCFNFMSEQKKKEKKKTKKKDEKPELFTWLKIKQLPVSWPHLA